MRPADLPFFPPSNARMHEVCGPGAPMFAFALSARLGGQLLWVQERWDGTRINPNGFLDFIDPARLTLCAAKDQTELLAVAEEALRSGAVALVVLMLSKPIGLTEGRRLQLAAGQGKSTGLAMIADGMGSNAAETRWRCSPVFNATDSTLHRWELIKNKSGTLGAWHVRWDTASRRLIMVSSPGE